MAATAWSFYNLAKKYIGNGTIKLGVDTFKVQLHTSASNASTFTLSTAASVSNEVASGNGYTTGGQALASVVWTVGASAKQYKFDCNDLLWTATGGNIANIKFAVIKNSAGKAVCWSRLTTAQFTLTSANTLTIQMNASGVFALV